MSDSDGLEYLSDHGVQVEILRTLKRIADALEKQTTVVYPPTVVPRPPQSPQVPGPYDRPYQRPFSQPYRESPTGVAYR